MDIFLVLFLLGRYRGCRRGAGVLYVCWAARNWEELSGRRYRRRLTGRTTDDV